MKRNQSTKCCVRPAMNLKTLLILLMSFVVVPAHAGTFSFPSTDSTAVCSKFCGDTTCWAPCLDCIGAFWSSTAGHQISQTFTDDLSSVNDAVLDVYVGANGLTTGNQVDWQLLINGTVAGTLEVDSGYTGEITLDTSFPAVEGIATDGGYNYTILFQVNNTVACGDGAISLVNTGSEAHQLVLSYTEVNSADVSKSEPRVRVTKRPGEPTKKTDRQCGANLPCAEGG